MADYAAGKAVRGACRLRRVAAGNPRREIAGVETVAGGGRVDRHQHFGHRHEFLDVASGDQCRIGPILDHDFADAEGLQPRHGALEARVAPQHGLVIEGRQRDIDALERLDENGTRALQVALPAARAEIAVEGDFGALLACDFEYREESAEPVIREQRQRDAGEVDEPRRGEAFGNAHPVRKLEQFAGRRAVAPGACVALAGWTTLSEA